MKCCKTPNRKKFSMKLPCCCFFFQEPIFVPDPVISLAVEPKNKVKTESKYQIVVK